MANVFKFTDTALKMMEVGAAVVGKYHSDVHDMFVSNKCIDLNMQSPIEQIMFYALHTVKEIHYLNSKSFTIIYQKPIDRFRADFEVIYSRPSEAETNPIKSVIVECDSQQFHERNEKERRYEKARDRHFQMKGYKVFRYTGKEIIDNPFKIACEILAFISNDDTEELYSWFLEHK